MYSFVLTSPWKWRFIAETCSKVQVYIGILIVICIYWYVSVVFKMCPAEPSSSTGYFQVFRQHIYFIIKSLEIILPGCSSPPPGCANEPYGSLPCSKQPANCPYPVPDQSNPQPPKTFLFQNSFNIIFAKLLQQWLDSSPKRPDRLWGPPSLLFNGYRGSFPVVKRPWRWPLNSIWRPA